MSPEPNEDLNDAIDRFWDQIVQNPAHAAEGLNLANAATIRHLHTFDDRPGPTLAFTQQLREELMHAHAIPISSDPRPALLPNHDARRAWLGTAPPLPVRRRSWAMPHLATAVLLLVLLGLGYVTVGPDRFRAAQPPAIPAAMASPATPATSEPVAQTLATITLPADTFPSQISGGLNHYTIPVETRSSTAETWVSTCCTGLRLDYVLSGTVTVRSTGPVQLLRPGASAWEVIAPETALSLNPGDAVLLRMEDAFAATNASVTPVDLLEGVLFGGMIADDPIPNGWDYHDQDILHSLVPMPPGPVTVRLHEATLEPGADLPLPLGAVLQLAVTLDERATVGSRGTFDKRNLGKAPVAIYVLTLEPAEAGTSPLGTPSP
jgi:hypothetical protein